MTNPPSTMKKETKIMELDTKVHNKLYALVRKYPQFCAEYLTELHKVLDWAEAELKKIK